MHRPNAQARGDAQTHGRFDWGSERKLLFFGKNVSYQSKTWEACRAITLICCWKRNTKPVWQKTFKYTKYNFLIMIIMIILCS